MGAELCGILKCYCMEERKQRCCPVCGSNVVGRSDKVFCSDDCRTFFHNRKYRECHKVVAKLECNSEFGDELMLIWANLLFLARVKSRLRLKFILFLSGFCKILSTFGAPMSNRKGE